MDAVNHFPLIIALLFHHAYVVTCCGVSLPYGNMTPDYDLEVGSTLKIECTLFTNSITVDDASYNVSSENLRLKSRKGYESVTVVDDLTIEYIKKSADVNDSGDYSCYLSVPGLEVDPLVCVTFISVGYKPLPVTNFSCISLEYSNLTCSWKKPFNPVATDYTLWDYFRHEILKRPCPVKINETSCEWRLDTTPVYMQSPEILTLFLIGNNSLGVNKQYINIEHFKIVKPGAPKKVMISNITRNSLTLHWLPPKGMEYQAFRPGLFYSIMYRPVFEHWKDYEEVTLSSNTEESVEIGNLVPYTEYTFIVRCRSNATDSDDMWSPSVVLSATTHPDVPYLAPEVTISSFEVETIAGNRTVTLYWKAIPFEYENGGNFHYIIQYHIYHVPFRKIREAAEINVGNVTLHSFPHLDRNSAYIFKVYAANNIGVSSTTSQVIVDKADKLLEGPKHIAAVSYGQGHYSLSWESPDVEIKNFTLFWCQNLSLRPVKCKGPLEWLHTSKTSHDLHLSEKNTNYQFAVASISNDRTSGMVWAPCVVSYNGVRYKVKNVELTPKNSTSVKIQWYLECDALKKVIKEYAIHYCEFGMPCSNNHDNTSCSDWKILHVRNVSQGEYILGSLRPYTCYQAFIRALTTSGWSENSNIVYEATMSSAPSDSPRDVKVLEVNGTSIHISFKPPLIPNGVITRYVVYYNKSADGTSHHKEIRTQEIDPYFQSSKNHVFSIQLNNFITYYMNYSIEVKACVDQACSVMSEPVYACTNISNPGIVSTPRIELADGFVNITWEPPVMPNGPVDFYQILRESNATEKDEEYNVTSQTYFSFKPICSENLDQTLYSFRVRAINLKDGVPLFGEFSKPAKSMLCPKVRSTALLIGISIGAAVGIIGFFMAFYCLIVWMKNEVASIKGTNIQLPKGLESPIENPLSSYDKFKNGLQKSHDSGIPYERSYDRLDSFASERDAKDVGNGYGINEQSHASKRSSSDRNNSGESNLSNKCHDSISSSNTTKTHISIDSGAEVDSSPSPEDLCSDTTSSNTTPRSNKNDLDVICENNGLNSKDSGLERDGTSAAFPGQGLELPHKFVWCVKKKSDPFSSLQIPKYDGFMPAYSKFAVLTASNSPSYVPCGDQNMGLLDNRSLSNSEPSVADFDVSNGSEPLIISGLQPYSKFGLARSASNVTHQPLSLNHRNANIGYSKFGIVYRPLIYHDRENKDNISPVSSSDLKTCLKALCNQPKILPDNRDKLNSSLKNVKPNSFNNQCWNATPVENKQKLAKSEQALPKQHKSNAYSKVGVTIPKEEAPKNPYVMFRDKLVFPSYNSGFSPDPLRAGYSKIGMTGSDDNSGLNQGNGIIINPACLPSHNGYVPFQNAGIINGVDFSKKKSDFIVPPDCEAELPHEISNAYDIDLEHLSFNGNFSKAKNLSPSHESNSKEVNNEPYILDSLSELQNNGTGQCNKVAFISIGDEIPEQKVTAEADIATNSRSHDYSGSVETMPVDPEDKYVSYSDSLVSDIVENNYNNNDDETCTDFRILNGVIKGQDQTESVLCNGQSDNDEPHTLTSSSGYVPLSELTKESRVSDAIIRPDETCAIESV